jgi:hypothetical protein
MGTRLALVRRHACCGPERLQRWIRSYQLNSHDRRERRRLLLSDAYTGQLRAFWSTAATEYGIAFLFDPLDLHDPGEVGSPPFLIDLAGVSPRLVPILPTVALTRALNRRHGLADATRWFTECVGTTFVGTTVVTLTPEGFGLGEGPRAQASFHGDPNLTVEDITEDDPHLSDCFS